MNTTHTVFLLFFPLAACVSSEPVMNENFGAAVRHNIALQTAYPDATGPDESASQEGREAQRAIEAYRERDTTEVETESLIDVGTGD